MSKTYKIFIGSSSEVQREAEYIAELIDEVKSQVDIKVQTVGWWEPQAFPPGNSVWGRLLELKNSCDGAILLTSPVDKTVKRGRETFEPRDNVILEYGLFSGGLHQDSVIIGTLGNAELPSNLDGWIYLSLTELNNNDFYQFKKDNKEAIRNWLNSFPKEEQVNIGDYNEETFDFVDSLPSLYSSILSLLNQRKEAGHQNIAEFDVWSSQLLAIISKGISGNRENIVNRVLQQDATDNHLRQCNGVFATDVIGPAQWVGAESYLYLATQIKYYVRKNVKNGKWALTVSRRLKEFISRACLAASKILKEKESLSIFDNPEEFDFSETDIPDLEFCRVLIWSREELEEPIAQTIIEIHRAFHIPLFYIEAEKNSDLRRRDFVLYRQVDGVVKGFYSDRSHKFELKRIDTNRQGNNILSSFYDLLDDNKPFLAIDALQTTRERNLFEHA